MFSVVTGTHQYGVCPSPSSSSSSSSLPLASGTPDLRALPSLLQGPRVHLSPSITLALIRCYLPPTFLYKCTKIVPIVLRNLQVTRGITFLS